jgi:hypothetical protein
MNSIQLSQSTLQDRFGRQVAARLAAGSAELPYEVSERLRAARTQALAKRKRIAALRTASSVTAAGGAATLTAGDEPLSWWNRVASALPIVALIAGLVVIHSIENERRASEVAEVDAALLTDDLPPSAYADSGFIQFLKQSGEE